MCNCCRQEIGVRNYNSITVDTYTEMGYKSTKVDMSWRKHV